MSKLKLSAQEGRALIMALIVLAVGTLLIPPFLAYVSTNLLASRATEEGMREQYAADAGVECAIGQLVYNPSFLSSVITTGVTTVITLPTPVNSISPITVTVTNSGTEFRAGGTVSSYVMWANSITCTEAISVPANYVTIGGDIHTNTDINIDAKIAEMTGTLEYVITYTVPAGMQFNPPPPDNPKQVSVTLEPPIQLDMADYLSPTGQCVIETGNDPEAIYLEIESCGDDNNCYDDFGVQQVDSMRVVPTGLYYVQSGDVYLEGRNLTGRVTIVAEGGGIYVGGNDAYLAPYCSDSVLLFSNSDNQTAGCTEDVIRTWGSDAKWQGIIYGLGGRIWTEGAGRSAACLIGNTILAEGAGSGIGLAAAGGNLLCPVFDITSVADDTTTAARIVLCSGTAYVVSWEIK